MKNDEDLDVAWNEIFCGWKINHKTHVGLDIIDGSEVLVCPGYMWVNDHV